MRWIRDSQPPASLIRCLADRRAAGQPLDYDEVSVVEFNGEQIPVRQAIRQARIIDQGYLCAYTLKRIGEETCHNEHLVPRSVSKQEGRTEETLDYQNIVACYPKKEGPGGCPYGAAIRGVRRLALTPLDSACESRLRFDRTSARFVPTDPNDVEVRELLDEVLMLNHPALIGERREAIIKAGVDKNSKRHLTAAQARRLADSVSQFQRGEKLTPFCVALAHAALAHADLIERRSRRMRSNRQ